MALATTDDIRYDFEFLKVTEIRDLDSLFTDDYGNEFVPGSTVLIGHFFHLDNLIDMTFKLEVKKIGAIYKNTVRHILSNFDPTRVNGTIYRLSLQQQEDIMASIY